MADYRTIDPAFGTLAEAEKLIAEARALGIRTIIDIVPNHVSDQHAWFTAALAAGPGSPERDLFHFRPGRGPDGAVPPNDWVSEFGGTPWTRLPDGEWYLHLFATQQPDLNWAHPAVRQEHEDVLRFWFERGVSGVRIDSAALPAKDPALPDFTEGRDPHPYIDRDELHDIYRSWRAIADEYGAIFVGEVWLPDAERFARYLRPDELHTAFNFNFLACPWDAGLLRSAIDDTLAEHAFVGAPATWVLCNHDVTRTVTRYGRQDTGFDFAAKTFGTHTDLALGTRRARAAALLSLALPGAAYLYQGRSSAFRKRTSRGTGSRTRCTSAPAGPTPDATGAVCRCPGRRRHRTPGSDPPWNRGCRSSGWSSYAADAQGADPDSMLSLYREALRLRRTEPGFGSPGTAGERLTWLPTAPGVLAFTRTDRLVCVVNLTGEAVELPDHTDVLLTSGPLADGGRLPQDTAAWLRG